MPFTPEEIENKEFLITLRGYDKDEVHAFLRAVASDYRGALEEAETAPPPPTGAANPYDMLGKEVSSVLQVARESADTLKRKSDEEAAAVRRRAEEEAANLRDAAAKAAKRLTEEAERHAVEVRASAERQAGDRVRETTRRVERLQSTEAKLRQRLYHLEMMLQSIRQELDSSEEAPEAAPASAPAPTSAPAGADTPARSDTPARLATVTPVADEPLDEIARESDRGPAEDDLDEGGPGPRRASVGSGTLGESSEGPEKTLG